MPAFSQKSLEKLATCDPKLQALFLEVIKHFDCVVLEGHRGKIMQDAAFAAGQSKTQWPQSKHNSQPSKAVDVAPYPIDWNDHGRFYYFGGFVMGIAAKMGIKIRYGGDWNKNTQVKDEKFKDLPHFELVE